MVRLSSIALATFVAITATASLAHAKDSTWLLCKGVGEHGAGADAEKTSLVVTLLEHRGGTDESRDLDVTLIYGVHILHGAVVGKGGNDAVGKTSPLELRAISAKGQVAFTGTADFAKDMHKLGLAGKIDWSFGDDPKQAMEPLKAKLTCEELDN